MQHPAVSLSVFQVDPLFTVPAPPPPISSSLTPQILPSYFSPSSSNIAAPVEQLLVRTRSVGVNTCEVGVVTEPECLGPCEPGTSVNLEGIVWHETEEGKYTLLLSIFPLMYCVMATGKGTWFGGNRRGEKSGFDTVWGFLLTSEPCFSFLFTAALTFRMDEVALKVACVSSASTERQGSRGEGYPFP